MPVDDEDVPAIEVVSRTKRRAAIDETARTIYLDALERTGSRPAASVAAKPHVRSRKSAMQTFQDHIASNPAFAAKVADIESKLTGKVDEEIYKRAMEGVQTFAKYDGTGKVMEERRDFDNNLLLKLRRSLARNIDPTGFQDEKRLIVSGGTQNTLAVGNVDAFLDGLSDDALRQVIAASERSKQLAAASEVEDDVEDAEIVPLAEAAPGN